MGPRLTKGILVDRSYGTILRVYSLPERLYNS